MKNTKQRIFFLGVVFLFIVNSIGILSACAYIPFVGIKPTRVQGLPGHYRGVTWVDDGLIVEYSDRKSQYQLWKIKPDGSSMEKLELPNFTSCDQYGFGNPRRLPDGRIAYAVKCQTSYFLMAFDLRTRSAEPLFNYAYQFHPQLDGYTWEPEMRRGVGIYNTLGLCGNLVWLSGKQLSDNIGVNFKYACQPRWSPDGTQIAFAAEPFGRTRKPQDDDHVFDIYLMNSDGSNVHSLVTGLRYQNDLAWSPDSKWIVFDSAHGNTRESSTLSLLHVLSGKQKVIAYDVFKSFAWSPDGKYLAVIGLPPHGEEEYPDFSALYVFDLTEMVKD